MAKFKVIGADKDTGIDVVETITADTAKEAGVLAQSRGLLVTSVERVVEDVSSQPAINIVNQNTNQNVNSGSRDNIHDGGFVYAFLSFFFPGLGQLCKGQILSAIIWCVATFIGYALFIVPGLIIHALCMVDAAKPIKR